jgi:hypothetical protein
MATIAEFLFIRPFPDSELNGVALTWKIVSFFAPLSANDEFGFYWHFVRF